MLSKRLTHAMHSASERSFLQKQLYRYCVLLPPDFQARVAACDMAIRAPRGASLYTIPSIECSRRNVHSIDDRIVSAHTPGVDALHVVWRYPVLVLQTPPDRIRTSLQNLTATVARSGHAVWAEQMAHMSPYCISRVLTAAESVVQRLLDVSRPQVARLTLGVVLTMTGKDWQRLTGQAGPRAAPEAAACEREFAAAAPAGGPGTRVI